MSVAAAVINTSDIRTVAADCQGSSVMSENNSASNIYAFNGTPFGVSFFAFTRFIGFAFYGSYYYPGLKKNRSSAYVRSVKENCAAMA